MKTYRQNIKGVELIDYVTRMGYFNQSYSCEDELFKMEVDRNATYDCDIKYAFDGFCEYYHLCKVHKKCLF